MKKFIVPGVLCLLAAASFGQVVSVNFNDLPKEESDLISPVVKEKIEEYALEVRKIVIEEKVGMNAEIAKVDSAFTAKTIDTSQAEAQKEEISQRYSDKIDERIQALHFDLDEITKKQVQFTILNTDVEKLTKEMDLNAFEKKHRPRNEITMFLSYGMMYLPDGDNELLNKHLGYSSGIDAGFMYHRQFNRASPWEFMTGIYSSYRTLRFDDDYYVNKTDEGEVELVQFERNLNKSKLRANYIVLPIGLQYNIAPLKTVEGISYRGKAKLSLSANVYGGLRTHSVRILKGDGIKQKQKGSNYNLNKYIFGAQFTLHLNSVNFFVRRDFTPYFEKGTFDGRKMLQFGINFGF